MAETTRREFFKIAGSSVAAFSIAPAFKVLAEPTKSRPDKLILGLASYTFRKFPLDKTLEMTQRLGLKKIAFKDFHLPLDSPEAVIKETVAKVSAAGLDLYGCGVVYMKNEAEVQHAFEYARSAGMKMIIGVPEHHLLELVNQKIKEFDIQVAIHNHGPGDERYPDPESAYQRIKNLDSRIGLCIDIGHTQRMGQNPAEAIWKFRDRLLDVHIKDVSEATKEGNTVEIGRGVIDIPQVLKTLLKLKFAGTVAFEYEKDGDDPLPGLAESVGYVHGVLAVI